MPSRWSFPRRGRTGHLRLRTINSTTVISEPEARGLYGLWATGDEGFVCSADNTPFATEGSMQVRKCWLYALRSVKKIRPSEMAVFLALQTPATEDMTCVSRELHLIIQGVYKYFAIFELRTIGIFFAQSELFSKLEQI